MHPKSTLLSDMLHNILHKLNYSPLKPTVINNKTTKNEGTLTKWKNLL